MADCVYHPQCPAGWYNDEGEWTEGHKSSLLPVGFPESANRLERYQAICVAFNWPLTLVGCSQVTGPGCQKEQCTVVQKEVKKPQKTNGALPQLVMDSRQAYGCTLPAGGGLLHCWGEMRSNGKADQHPKNVRFTWVALEGTAMFGCAIREDNSQLQCWPDADSIINPSLNEDYKGFCKDCGRPPADKFESVFISSGRQSGIKHGYKPWLACGLLLGSRKLRCWGPSEKIGYSESLHDVFVGMGWEAHKHSDDSDLMSYTPPKGSRLDTGFHMLSIGESMACGVTVDAGEVLCFSFDHRKVGKGKNTVDERSTPRWKPPRDGFYGKKAPTPRLCNGNRSLEEYTSGLYEYAPTHSESEVLNDPGVGEWSATYFQVHQSVVYDCCRGLPPTGAPTVPKNGGVLCMMQCCLSFVFVR